MKKISASKAMKAASQLEVEDTTGKEWTEDDEDNMNSNIASTSPTNPEIFPEIFQQDGDDIDDVEIVKEEVNLVKKRVQMFEDDAVSPIARIKQGGEDNKIVMPEEDLLEVTYDDDNQENISVDGDDDEEEDNTNPITPTSSGDMSTSSSIPAREEPPSTPVVAIDSEVSSPPSTVSPLPVATNTYDTNTYIPKTMTQKSYNLREVKMSGFNVFFDEMERLRSQIDSEVEQTADIMNVLDANLEAANIENRSLSAKIGRLNVLVSKLTSEKEGLKSTHTSEKQDLKNKIDVMTEEMYKAFEEKTKLINALANMTQAKADLESKVETNKQDIHELEEQKTDLESMLEDRGEEITTLEASLKACTDVSNSKTLQIGKLSDTNQDLNKALQTKTEEANEMTEEMYKAFEEKTKLINALANMTQAKADLESKVETNTHDIHELEEQKTDLESMLEDRGEEVTTLEASLKACTDVSNSKTLQIGKLSDTNQDLNKALQSKTDEANESKLYTLFDMCT